MEISITLSLVERLVREQFPEWAQLPIRPVEFDGWDNRTFRLGETMSIRLPSAAKYADQVKKEQQWLPHLAPHLPLPIPTPLGMGEPTDDYPYHWSVYRWLEGENASKDSVSDMHEFATDLARFLLELQCIDPAGGPPPGLHNFHRGGQLTVYDAETRDTVIKLEGQIEADLVIAVWEAALQATWLGPPVWVHGDIFASNMLVKNGKLSAVIDFGCSAVGDPACDLIIAWSLFEDDSREAFRRILALDDATWARAHGWALWKAILTVERRRHEDSLEGRKAHEVIRAVLAEHLKIHSVNWNC